MRIRMLQSTVASPDEGVNNYHYEAGREYEATEPLDYSTRPLPISAELAAQFVADGLAVDADAESGDVSAPESPAASPVEQAAEAPTAEPVAVESTPEPTPAEPEAPSAS